MLHPIEHVWKVPLSMHDGKMNHMDNVLHVPTITKNLTFVDQMVNRGLLVKFHKHACFVEDFQSSCRLIAKKKELEECSHWM